MKIIMLPCAGGNSLMFKKISALLEKSIEVHCLDYPGHGKLIHRPLLKTIEEISEDLITEMDKRKIFDSESYILLGYSMGAIVCYEITRVLMARQIRLPEHLLICASSANYIENSYSLELMSDTELYKYLKELGGVEKELLENREFQDFYYPIITADIIALNHYNLKSEKKLSVCATILYGSEDNYTPEEMNQWELFFNGCTIEEIKGNHFFINESTAEMKDILEKRVLTKGEGKYNEANDKTAAAGAANGEIHWGKRSNINL